LHAPGLDDDALAVERRSGVTKNTWRIYASSGSMPQVVGPSSTPRAAGRRVARHNDRASTVPELRRSRITQQA
jgi:hypothetical protein